jgi:pSer/pThr/pTyr-binding forkhead associated (FHA) protein
MIKISVYYEDKLVTEFEQANEKDISVGRAAGCSIQLDEASISRLHAVIRREQGSWILERRASFGAVLLNGNEVENAPLEGGEDIAIGKFNLRVNIESGSREVAPAETDGGVYREDAEGRTRVVEAGLSATFRFEPGTANVAEFVMEKEAAVFGRGSNCDVILTEKKASRKHCEIRRQGLSFFVKDLNSANGLLVNGVAATEQELVPGDVIQIGECQIQFIVENRNYFSQQDQFLPVPSHLRDPMVESPYAAPDLGRVGGLGMESERYSEPAAASGDAAEPPLSSTDYVGRFKRAWSKIPKAQRMRYLTILVLFSLVTAMLGGPDEAPKPKPKAVSGSKLRTYAQLTKAKKKFVDENYGSLLKAQEQKNYEQMLVHTGNILTYVDEFKDTGIYEQMAKKKIEEIAEEKRRAEAEKKQEETRRQVKALEEKGRPIYEKALGDVKFRAELDSLIQEIYTKDPNNRLAQEWKEGIKNRDLKDREEAEAARIQEEKKQAAEAQLAAVRSIFDAGQFVKTLAEADKLAENNWNEGDYRERVEKLKEEARSKLSSIIDPLLREASQQRGEGGDLVKANQLYSEVLKVDASNRDALSGKSAIKEILHSRAKRFYAEAILAESVSDLPEAKDKFEKCLRTAPENDSYQKRCRNKLSRFEYFNNSGGSGPSF